MHRISMRALTIGHVSIDDAVVRLGAVLTEVVLRRLPPFRSCATAAIEALDGVTWEKEC